MTNNLGEEEEAEAFFRIGEEGTYEGGPATLAPLAVNDEPAEVWDFAAADERLDRRRRLQRLVATVVGGLSAGLVVLSVCLFAAHSRSTKDAGRTPRPAPAPRIAAAAIRPTAMAVAVQPVMPTPPAEAKSAPEPAPSRSPRTEPVARTRSIVVTAPRQQASIDQRRPSAAVTLPRGGADLPALSGVIGARREPPTAFFPN